jgi:carbon-monoxide dehydrogenase medium subunit
VPPSGWYIDILHINGKGIVKITIGRRSMPLWKNYQTAFSINDALQALTSAPGTARLVDGGTDLLLDLQQGHQTLVDTLVDISRIPELLKIEERSGNLVIGAAVPLSEIVRSTLVQYHAQALVEASALIEGPQVRNSATLGGNVGHALPAADGTITLLALGARAEVANHHGRATVPLKELFVGPGRSNLHPQGDLIVGFYLPQRKVGTASAFKRIMRSQGVALPILNLSVWLHRRNESTADDWIEEIRISMGSGGPVPTRVIATEDFLQTQPLREQVITESLDIFLREVRFRSSPHRASSGYRQKVVKELFRTVLISAWDQAY